MQAQQAMKTAGTWQENVNQVIGPALIHHEKDTSYINTLAGRNPGNNQNNSGPSRQNEYREHHQAYMVFVTEPDDKQSQHRRSMELHVVMPAVPMWMDWSDQSII